jgi:hypothetical protein
MPVELAVDGSRVEPRRLGPDVDIHAGCSWVTGLYDVERMRSGSEATITFRCPDPEVEIYAESWVQKGG